MVIDRIKNVFSRKGNEPVELPEDVMEPEQPKEKVTVRIENLGGVNDIERLEKLVKSGNILILKVGEMQKRDLGQFKQSVQMIRRRAMQFGWDLVAVEDGYIVITPKFAKILR